MFDISQNEDQTNNEKAREIIIHNLNMWAESFEFHNIKEFGKLVNIKKILYLPVRFIRITSQIESRTKGKKSIPFNNQKCPELKYTSLDDFSSWDFDLDKISIFEKLRKDHVVRGSQKVETCHTCHGQKEITCTSCHGKGKWECPTCSGKGKTTCSSCHGSGKTTCSSCHGSGSRTCSNCGGSGYKTAYRTGTKSNGDTYSYQENVSCPNCGGHGKIRCTNCGGSGKKTCTKCNGYGKITCKECKGEGIIICKTCHGHGKIKCTTCDGKGKLYKYFYITQNIFPKSQTAAFYDPIILDNFPEFNPLMDEWGGTSLYNKTVDNYLSEDLLKDTQMNIDYINLLKPTTETHKKEGLINQQNVLIKEALCHYIEYEFEGKLYNIVFWGDSANKYASQSPFSDMRDTYYEKAKKYYKSKKYGLVMDYIEMANNLDENDELYNELNEMYQSAQKKAFSLYKIGSFLGTVLSIVLLCPLIYKLLLKPTFVLPYFQEVYNNAIINYWSNDFYGISMSIILGFLILFNIRKPSKSLINKIGNRIRSGLTKLLISFIVSILYSIFIAITVYLLHLSGLSLFIVYIMHIAYDFISNIVNSDKGVVA